MYWLTRPPVTQEFEVDSPLLVFNVTKCFLISFILNFKVVGTSVIERLQLARTQTANDRILKFCVWRAMAFDSFLHPQENILVQFSLYVHTIGI